MANTQRSAKIRCLDQAASLRSQPHDLAVRGARWRGGSFSMHGAPWSLKIGTGPGNNRIKRLAQSECAWHKASWSYTMMLLAHAGGHFEGPQEMVEIEVH